MDIAGAKALKQRLGPNGTDEAPRVRADVPADAPPVYHWTGVSKLPSESSSADAESASASDAVSLFSRLGLSAR